MVDSAKQFISMVHALDLIPLGSTDVNARDLVMLAPPVKPEGFATMVRRQYRRGLMTRVEMQLELGMIGRADVRGPIRVTRRKTR